jgi:hypothetical protein
MGELVTITGGIPEKFQKRKYLWRISLATRMAGPRTFAATSRNKAAFP